MRELRSFTGFERFCVAPLPLLLPCAGLLAGIVADAAVCCPISVSVSVCVAALMGCAVSEWRGVPRLATVLLGLAAVGLGAARHHQSWSVMDADHIRLRLTAADQPCRIVGRVVSRPTALAPGNAVPQRWAESRWWRCQLQSEWIGDARTLERVSGGLELRGVDVSDLRVGERVDAYGRLALPPPARNPGEFDTRRALRRRGVWGIVRVSYSGCLRVVPTAARPIDRWVRSLDRLRARIQSDLAAVLTPRTQGTAVALMIGDRSGLSHEQRRVFVTSGTMHMLAISGLHVGVLASMLNAVCRAFGTSRVLSVAGIVTAIAVYVVIVGSRPSVVRAAVLVSVLMLGRPWWRHAHVWHRLTLAAIGMLLWDPLVVFDIGAQLSYLAILGLSYAQMSLGLLARGRGGDLRSTVVHLREQNRIHSVIGGGWRYLKSYTWAYAMIWLFTAPLAANAFHVLAPIGLVTNFVLIHAIGVILVFGFLIVVSALVHPDLARLPGAGLEFGLDSVLSLVNWAARQQWGHFDLGHLPLWWLLGHYGLLGLLLFKCWRCQRSRWGWVVLGWMFCGVLCVGWRTAPDELRCRFLDVGHGSAVLVELPSGHTLLYDCGSMQGGYRAAQTVHSVMREIGLRRLDTLIISHADIDHCNGVAVLLNRVSVGRIVVARSFWDRNQRVVREVLAAAKEHNVAVVTVSAGWNLSGDPRAAVTILHPQAEWLSTSDNANSIVLQITCGGQRLLLPGDLEADGLAQLLKLPSRSSAVLMALHHGSRSANTSLVADWARPAWVIVSSGRQVRFEHLQTTYGQSQVLGTSRSGAITVRIGMHGRLVLATFLTSKD